MEGGQKQNIPLDSPIDVKSSDMMVHVAQPRFLHNRQRFQGHVLPTSVRYEHDGYACGWDVWNFDVYEHSYNPLESNDEQGPYRTQTDVSIVRYMNNSNPSYVLIFRKNISDETKIDMARIWFNTTSRLKSVVNGDAPNVTLHEGTTTVQGNYDGYDYTININPVTGVKQIFPSDEWDLETVVLSNGTTDVTITNLKTLVNFHIDQFMFPGDIYLKSNLLMPFASFVEYRRDVGAHGMYLWRTNGDSKTGTIIERMDQVQPDEEGSGERLFTFTITDDTFIYDVDTDILLHRLVAYRDYTSTVTGDIVTREITIDTEIVSKHTTDLGRLDFVYYDTYEGNINIEFLYTVFYTAIRNMIVAKQEESIGIGDSKTTYTNNPVNTEEEPYRFWYNWEYLQFMNKFKSTPNNIKHARTVATRGTTSSFNDSLYNSDESMYDVASIVNTPGYWEALLDNRLLYHGENNSNERFIDGYLPVWFGACADAALSIEGRNRERTRNLISDQSIGYTQADIERESGKNWTAKERRFFSVNIPVRLAECSNSSKANVQFVDPKEIDQRTPDDEFQIWDGQGLIYKPTVYIFEHDRCVHAAEWNDAEHTFKPKQLSDADYAKAYSVVMSDDGSQSIKTIKAYSVGVDDNMTNGMGPTHKCRYAWFDETSERDFTDTYDKPARYSTPGFYRILENNDDVRVPRFPSTLVIDRDNNDYLSPNTGDRRVDNATYAREFFFPDIVEANANCYEQDDYSNYDTIKYTCPMSIAIANYKRGMGEIDSAQYAAEVRNFYVWQYTYNESTSRRTKERVFCNYEYVANDATPIAQNPIYLGTVCRETTLTIASANFNGVVCNTEDLAQYVHSWITSTRDIDKAAAFVKWYNPNVKDSKVALFDITSFKVSIGGGSSNDNLAKNMQFELTKKDGFFRIDRISGYNNYITEDAVLYETDYRKTAELGSIVLPGPGSSTPSVNVPYTELYGGRKYVQNIVDKHIQDMHFKGVYAICVKGRYRLKATLNNYIYQTEGYVREADGSYKTYVDINGITRNIPNNPAYSVVFDMAAESVQKGIYIDRSLNGEVAKDTGAGNGSMWKRKLVTMYDFTKYDAIRHTPEWDTYYVGREEQYGEYGSHSMFRLPYAEITNDSNPVLSDDDKMLSRDKDYTLHAYLTAPVSTHGNNKVALFYHNLDSSCDSDADYRLRTRFFVPGHIWLGADMYDNAVDGFDDSVGYNPDIINSGAGLHGYVVTEQRDLPQEYNIEICISAKAWQYYKVDPWTTEMLVADVDENGDIIVDEHGNVQYHTENVYTNVNSNWNIPNGLHPVYSILNKLNRNIKFVMLPQHIDVMVNGFIMPGSYQSIIMQTIGDHGTYEYLINYMYDEVGGVVPVDTVSEKMILVSSPTMHEGQFTFNITDVSGTTSFKPIFSYDGGFKSVVADNTMELLIKSNMLTYSEEVQLACCINNGAIDNDFIVKSYMNGIAQLHKISDDEDAEFNRGTATLIVENKDSFSAPEYITVYDLYAEINAQYRKRQKFNIVTYGPYKYKNIDIKSLDSNWLVTRLDVDKYDVHKYYKADITTNGVFTPNVDSNMSYIYTDVTDPDMKDNVVLSIDPNEENQVLKQDSEFTNEVEWFWWIDDTHILKLDKHKLVLEELKDELDDWGANTHEVTATYNRFKYITGDVMQYGVTNAYKAECALFYTITEFKEHFEITFYDVLDDMRSFSVKAQTTFHGLGEKLITRRVDAGVAKLNTYSALTNGMVARGSRLSSTRIGNTILFGVHYDNNFNQWTLVINAASRQLENVIQGYGFVSLKGILTGGEIPSRWFDPHIGFTGTVQPLEYLRDDENSVFKSKDVTATGIIEQGIPNGAEYVVGNEAQQWYLSRSLTGIVSHVIAYDDTNIGNEWVWRAETIDITNNYSAKYASPSFYTRTISDYIPFAKGLTSVFPISTSNSTVKKITKVLSTIASVLGAEIYGIYPKINTAGYLQQALGQYAYVHYNSSDNYIEKDKVEKAADNPYAKDELSFYTLTVNQKATIKNAWGFFMGLLGQFAVSACDMSIDKLMANTHQNQTDTGNKGEKYTDNFIRNLDAMASTEMTVQSATPTLNSKVVSSLTLDMFYSTSEKQKVYAGPGFVNHNFVAQCVAQSVTSKHFELNQIGILLILKAITMFQIEKTIFIEETIIEFTQYYANSFSRQTVPVPFGGSSNIVANVAALVMTIANKAAKVALAITKFIQKYVPDLIDSIGANRMQTNVLARQSSHTYDIEGKHKYGSRSECFMYPCVVDGKYTIPNEYVEATAVDNPWSIDISQWSDSTVGKSKLLSGTSVPINCAPNAPNVDVTKYWEGNVPYYTINCKGVNGNIDLPDGMAYVIGTEAFLPKQAFKNQNIGESNPVFPTPVIQDYVIDSDWGLYMTATAGEIAWVSCKDTKIIDGAPTNIFINNNFCGIASAYAALQIRDTIDKRFVRPYAVTPNAIALNQTGYNCCYDRKVYHAFDGYGYRLAHWIGATGMGSERQVLQYSFISNDRFKRSNKLPPNQFMGNFKSAPEVNIRGDHNDKIFSAISIPGEIDSLIAGTASEDKDVIRYAIPVFTELINTLPAAVKTNAAYTLAVVDGITSLCTDLRNVQFAYKSPRSVDFNIGGNLYRYTSEYISAIVEEQGTIVVNNLVPVLGLSFLGATPYEAYLYSQATRQYYVFHGGTRLDVVDMIERFRNVTDGKYDFVNQEVVMPCLATFDRLDKQVHDDDSEIDNIMVPVLKTQDFVSELSPPTDTIFNDKSWFKTLSIPAGMVFQGPNRCIISRYVVSDYMYKGIKENAGNWKKVPREDYHPMRKYNAKYETVDEQIGFELNVNGWTHNPFLLVTSPLGISENIDCVYEWEITFAWTVDMDRLYNVDQYVCVNVSAETMTPGGKVTCRPTHVYLTKELFTRSGNYGYYSVRFQSKNGAGNRERLHVWSDGYIAISGIQCEYKPITERRTEILTQQLDIQKLKEF